MRAIALSCLAAVAVAGLFLASPAWIISLNARACDIVAAFAASPTPSDRILLVEIDDRSLARHGRWPWPRDTLAQLVNRLYDQRVATVVLDLMFPEEDSTISAAMAGQSNDAALATALARGVSVVGYAFRFFPGQDMGPAQIADPLPLVVSNWPNAPGLAPFRASGAVPTTPVIGASTNSGFLNAAPDRDGRLRLMPLIIEYRDRYYPSLALAAFNAYRNTHWMQLEATSHHELQLRLDDTTIPLEGPACLRIQFHGEGPSFTRVSADDVLNGTVTADRLRGKLAVIGGSAAGIASAVPNQPSTTISSAEIQATALDNLIRGEFAHRPASAPGWEAILALAAALAATALLVFAHPRWAFLAAICGVFAAWPLAMAILATTHLLFSPLPFTATAGANLTVLLMLGYRRQKRRAEQAAQALASARNRTQQLIEYSESRYERLVENINDAILAEDPEGRLLFANRRFREWFGLGEDPPAGLRTDAFIAPEWRTTVASLHQRILQGDPAPDHIEYEGLRPDGSRLWIEALITRVEENGHVMGLQSALRDITERRRLEDQFLQAQKMESVGILAGGVAHDFNNLVTVINGYCELLLMDVPLDDALRTHVEQISQAGARAAELTQQLLAFSRKQLIRPRPVSLNGLVNGARNLLRMMVGDSIELVTSLQPGLGMVMADEGQFHQVLLNLAANARDSMPSGGRLTIETRNVTVDEVLAAERPMLRPGDYVVLAVSDSGTGMTEEVKRRIFEPFYTTKEHGKGTGLGLATVYGIVRQSGGDINVWSEVGTGTVFQIYLPRVAEEVPATAERSEEARALKGGETILLVEDQEMVLRFATRILETHGYRVLAAHSGPEAIEKVRAFDGVIHLLVTDVIMPRMNGRALAEALYAARPEMKVLYTSGYAEDVISDRGILGRDLPYLPKPYTPRELLMSVRTVLGGSAAAGASA